MHSVCKYSRVYYNSLLADSRVFQLSLRTRYPIRGFWISKVAQLWMLQHFHCLDAKCASVTKALSFGFGSFFEHNTYDQGQFAHLDNSCRINTQKTSTVSWPLHPPPSLWANGFDRKRTINIWILKVWTKLWGSQWANILFLVARIPAERRRRRRREVLEGWGFKMSTSFCGMENNGQTTRGCRRRARRVQGDGEEMQETWRRV